VSRPGDHVTAVSRGGATVFEVTSETGLGSAEVQQVAGAAAEALTIRLHLRGLEQFDFSYGAVTVLVSVSSNGDNAVSEAVRLDSSGETTIGPDSPFWMPVDVIPAAGSGDEATGVCSVDAPRDFVQGTQQAFSMRWIDFYR
jgi:hypothetical protein